MGKGTSTTAVHHPNGDITYVQVPRDARQWPEPGDTAIRRRGKTKATVTRVQHHRAGDVSYIHLHHETGFDKEVVHYEWLVDYRDHQEGPGRDD